MNKLHKMNISAHKIYAFHLLNDYSGSPKVLLQLAADWVAEGREVTVVTCADRQGFLSDIQGVSYQYFQYKWAPNAWLRLFFLIVSQWQLLWMMIGVVKKEDLVYVNTVLPFGAAFLGKIKGCRVVYHIHETSMKPLLLKKILFGIVRFTADDVVYVSRYLANEESITGPRIHIVYNSIEPDFARIAATYPRAIQDRPSHILMVCSLKAYKGINEFVELACNLPQYQFRLVLNASQDAIDAWLSPESYPDNLEVFATQTNLHPFYQWADLVLNLSRPDGWVETFGLTILEGMTYGLPAIVPPVGGVTELIDDGSNGYWVDCRNTQLLQEKVVHLFESPETYTRMCASARKKSVQFGAVPEQ